MTNLDSIFKSRDITLQTKVRLVKAMVFPVVMYGCESWTMKKADLLQNGLVGSPCSPRDPQESSPTPQFKSINYFLYLNIQKNLILHVFFSSFCLKDEDNQIKSLEFQEV